ncbi:hypothetical protein [Hymenobacter tenuis]
MLLWLGVLNVFFAQRPHPRLAWWASLPVTATPFTATVWRNTLRYATRRWALGLFALLLGITLLPPHSPALLPCHVAFVLYAALIRRQTAQHLARLQALA